METTLNAAFLRDLSLVAEDEQMMKKVSAYVRRLVVQKANETDETAMTKEEFFAKIDRARSQVADGKGITFANKQDMNAWLEAL